MAEGSVVHLSNGMVGVWQSEKGERFCVKVDGVDRVFFKSSVQAVAA